MKYTIATLLTALLAVLIVPMHAAEPIDIGKTWTPTQIVHEMIGNNRPQRIRGNRCVCPVDSRHGSN